MLLLSFETNGMEAYCTLVVVRTHKKVASSVELQMFRNKPRYAYERQTDMKKVHR